MANTLAQDALLKVLFPKNWNKKNTKKRINPKLKYDALFGATEK